MTDAHEEKETLQVEVNIPEHADRVTTSTFTRTRKALLERDGARCWVCSGTADKVGPLEAHHYPIERSLAEMIDWKRVANDAKNGEVGIAQAQRNMARAFDWDAFFDGANEIHVPEDNSDPGDIREAYSYLAVKDPYSFVDNMLVNGVLLCKVHHIGKDEGIHAMPHPLWIAQRYGQEGYKFSDVEIIHHQEGAQ